mmetsp:Transcript_86410/g.252865  ORF Transcript_86410/g.252865 Transcript_86410/m.252865 type:complete len:187 (+) Transcript_86410:82-642(+)
MGQVVSILLKQCADMEHVLIETVLGWLTPIDQDFGPFAVELRSASIDDNEDTHIDLNEFNLEGVGLHGTVSADLPGLGRQELPINLNLGMNKSFENRECTVNVNNFDFDANDHADDSETKSRDLMSDLGGALGGLMSGGLMGAFQNILQMDAINGWVCQQVSGIINDQLKQRLGGGDDDSEGEESD